MYKQGTEETLKYVFRFEGETKVTAKAKKLVDRFYWLSQLLICWRAKEEGASMLTLADKGHILAGEKLDDRHIDIAQNMLKEQFSKIGGLQSTLLQVKPQKQHIENKTFFNHNSRGDHWIVAATMFATDDRVLVCDSVYHTLDQPTKNIILNLFPAPMSTQLVRVNR